MLARGRPRIDVPSLAWAYLNENARGIARAYYHRLERHQESSQKNSPMSDPRFLQIHFLAPYAAALLNRDDAGLRKRCPMEAGFGRGSVRNASSGTGAGPGPDAMSTIDGADAAYRSREIVERKVLGDWADGVDKEIIKEIGDAILKVVYGDKGAHKSSRQTCLLGEVEVAYLAKAARALVTEAAGDKEAAKSLAASWLKNHKANLKALSEGAKLPGGLTGALFGRMVTSDPSANIDARFMLHMPSRSMPRKPRAIISSPPTISPRRGDRGRHNSETD